MRQDGYPSFTFRLIVLGREEPSERRLEPEGWEVAARHRKRIARKGLACGSHVGVELPVRGQARERRLACFEVAEHRIAEDRFTRTGHAAGCGAWLRAGREQVDEPTGIRDRQGSPEQLIEGGENRRI